MLGSCKYVYLLHRCVTARHISTSILGRIKHLESVLPIQGTGRCGVTQYLQHHKWASSLTQSLLRVSKHQSAWSISQHSLSTEPGTPLQDDEYPPLPAFNSDPEPEKREVYIVQTKGLPWSCTAEDLLQFFSECRIRDGVKGIHLTVNRSGRPNGQAFIEMEDEEDVSKALEKHRQYLGPRYVEVFEVTNSVAEAILNKSVQMPANDGVVRLRGLPFSCTEAEIVTFFSGLDIVDDGVTIVTDRRGRNTGEAYVQFASQEIADEALQRDREVIGNRYIEVFPSGSKEIHAGWTRQTESDRPLSGPKRSDTVPQPNPKTSPGHSSVEHCIHMRGLPFQATGHDVVQFFSPLALSKIFIEYGPDGRASGEADVYFTCHEEAVSAMSKDKTHMRVRYIELFLNSVPEAK